MTGSVRRHIARRPSIRSSPKLGIGLAAASALVALSTTLAAEGPGPDDVEAPQDVFKTDLIAFPDPWSFQLGTTHLILVADQQLVDLASDPDRAVNTSLDATPRLETLRQVCERAKSRDHRTLSIAFDWFWAQYRTDVRGVPRRLWPDMDRYVELVGAVARFAAGYGLGIELSLLSPLEIGRGYRERTGESGRWLHWREGPRDPSTGAWSVELWRQQAWTNNKGTIAVEDAGVRAFAFREQRVGGTPYWIVRPEDIVEISDTARVEVMEGLRSGRRPSSAAEGEVAPGYAAVRVRIHGAGRTDVGPLDRVLAVQVYRTPEMDYFSPTAMPFLRGLIDRYVEAGVRFHAIYADETHIQGDWGYFSHHDMGEFALRYVSPGLERRFAERHGEQYSDFARWLVYFARGQHDSANDLTARMGTMHVPGGSAEEIQRASLSRARYYELLQDGVVGLFADAKRHLEHRVGRQVHSRAHATWAQSPTIDFWDVGRANADAWKYEYTSSFVWSNTVHQAATACHDYFRWGDFLHGSGNDTCEGGFLDRNYWGFALASSLGILNRVRNAYAAHWGMPAAVSRRRSALADAWGTWPSWPYGIVEDMDHREVDVLMLYPLDLVAADERFGSWMTQYAYADWIPQATLLDRGRLDRAAIEVAGRRYRTLVATFEPLPRAGLLDLMERFARAGGRLVWSGPPPILTREGDPAIERWQRVTGARYVPSSPDGLHAAGCIVEFAGALAGIEPMTILTDLLPDRVYPVEPGPEAETVVRLRGAPIGTHRKLGEGTVTYLGFRPRDDQSRSLGRDERHWFDVLAALGAYPPSGKLEDAEDNTERIARTTPVFAARFPNGAVSVAPHLRELEESWPGGFHRDPEEDARIAARLALPPERLELRGLKVAGHAVDWSGDGAMAFRVASDGELVAFAGRGGDRVTIDGRETVFADRPVSLVAWAPVPEDRRVEGGATILVRAAGAGELRIPAPGLRSAAVFREGPTPGSRGAQVECRIDGGRVIFRSAGGEAWYYIVP